MQIGSIITYEGDNKSTAMTKNQKYDTSYENKIKEADSDILFNCDPSQYIKRLSCNFFQNSVTKYVDNPNNQL